MNFCRILLPAVLILIGGLLLLGCIVVPVGRGGVDPVGRRVEAERGNVKVDAATRGEVVQRLGPPTFKLNDDRLFVYAWQSRNDVTFHTIGLCTPSSQNTTDFGETSHHLLLQFDDAGVLRRQRRASGGRLNLQATGIEDAVR